MLKALTFILAVAAAPVPAQTVTIETFRGPVDVAEKPQTIAVLDLAALDTLTALGVQANGAVRPFFIPFLEAAAADSQPIGSLFEPDFEALNALQPDLIIAGGRSTTQVPALAKLAPTLDMTIDTDIVAEGLVRLKSYGQIFDRADKAAALATAFEAKLQQARAAAKNKGTALIVMTNGPKVSAYGAAGRFGWLYNAVGLKPAITEMETTTHGEAISFEFIRDANPDMLIVIDRLAAIGRDGASAQATLDNALVHETKAWSTGAVIYLSPAPIYIAGGGIQSMTQTLDELIAALSDS
ncbi:siderophore ABC transporter substrate-binding protein [Roseobacter sp. N2S]|uniref:siderophore ABC transporter substrate-binding protein n=1 Tax=Roseobacter sp. N2S TaxID=2663844 RepID=UPI0028652942|nr:siderophore ABC transporter substrate-binding protein [Roseobacter sp. N2S]MDR6266503.1 iron complex transport system substrate-binding protein [Roseobacter sp. N2S]